MTLILASGSPARRRLLEAAGIAFELDGPRIDEEAAKARLRAEGATPRDQAVALAELKALSVSARRDGFVIGADQMLAFEGRAFDKPKSASEAREHLLRLRGRTHELITAAVVAVGDTVIWRHVDTPRLTMRAFSDTFLEDYLERAGDNVLMSVGAYQIEGLGAQLFERVEGDYFSILGLQLLPLLAFLREQGIALR
ncbi:MAG TPA: Maf family nucleotide pyrophosphatase [Candidatus Binatia bacterium]|nr:Maf family nucleotide pyrophosphatase [Candidatus Binatia bacterium]